MNPALWIPTVLLGALLFTILVTKHTADLRLYFISPSVVSITDFGKLKDLTKIIWSHNASSYIAVKGGQVNVTNVETPYKKADSLDKFPYLNQLPVFVNASTIDTPRPFRWKPITQDQVPFQFSPEELGTFDGVYNAAKVTSMCGMGVISAGGGQRYHASDAKAHRGCYTKKLSKNTWNQPQHVPNYMTRFAPFIDSVGTERNYLFGVRDIMELLPDKSDIVVIGDSVTHQYFDAMSCSLARESKPNQFTKYDTFVRKKKFWRIGASSRDEISFRTRNNLDVKLVFHPEYVFASSGNTIREACAGGRTRVLIVNFGLHWNQVKPYEKDMNTLSKFLKQHCMDKGIQVIFRGTTTQHFMQFGGNFAFTMKRTKEYAESIGIRGGDADHMINTTEPMIGCTKVFYTGQSQLNRLYNWRNRVATKVFKENGFDVIPTPWGRQSTGCVNKTALNNTIFYVPFGEVTFDQYDKHNLECTHYCSTPQLWQPIHDAIYLALRQTTPQVCSQNLGVEAVIRKPTSPLLPKLHKSKNCNFLINASLLEDVYDLKQCLSV
uniref:Uncharacterized protein n=1 Tax=Mucochytrium quahogii TaxID=96639 RepID=A0A7S2S6T7_9STRA|mmetsp:Transcript_25615/g.55566  ORF Transcript_25615/g.55566 Transcript_25615/m.55566 type:complete len:550 (+) Transcript_25615:211-1860(+)